MIRWISDTIDIWIRVEREAIDVFARFVIVSKRVNNAKKRDTICAILQVEWNLVVWIAKKDARNVSLHRW